MSITNLQINGDHFKVATDWPVNEVQVGTSDQQYGDTPNYLIVAYDPEGPNAQDGQAIVNFWTDTFIDFDFTSVEPWVIAVRLFNVDRSKTSTFVVQPSQPAIPGGGLPTVQSASSPAAETLQLNGINFLAARRFRVIADQSGNTHDTFYYIAPADTALNPVDATVTASDTEVTIEDPALAGKTITYIQARKADNTTTEFYGTVPIGSGVTSYFVEDVDSPEPNTIHFLGTGFDQVDAFAVNFGGSDYNYYAPGSPNGTNPAGAVVTITPTELTIVDPELNGQVFNQLFAYDDEFNTVMNYGGPPGQQIVVGSFLLNEVQAVGPGHMVLFGARFQTADQPLDQVYVVFADASGYQFYVPGSPNEASNPAGFVSGSFTDSGWDFTNPDFAGKAVDYIYLYNTEGFGRRWDGPNVSGVTIP